MMQVPCLEILGGRLVADAKGADDARVLHENPLEAARLLQKHGALFFQITDLDAAFGSGNNDDVLRGLAERTIPFQVGGGIRSAARAEELFALGADRVVVGTMMLAAPDEAKALVGKFGRRVIAAVDDRDGQVLVSGRAENDARSVAEAIAAITSTGAETLTYSRIGDTIDIDADIAAVEAVLGQLENVELFARVGAESREDRDSVRALEEKGLAGIVLGAGYYEAALSAAAPA